MEHIVKFSKIKKSILIVRFLILYTLAYILIISTKYIFQDIEIDYFKYFFSFKHYGITNLIVDIMFLFYLFENKTVQYDNKKISLQSSLIFDKNIIINYSDIVMLTYRLGVASIRTKKDIIVLDNFTFNKKDIKQLIHFLELESKHSFNSEINKKSIIVMILFLSILISLYLFNFELYS